MTLGLTGAVINFLSWVEDFPRLVKQKEAVQKWVTFLGLPIGPTLCDVCMCITGLRPSLQSAL